ncbi:MAG: hypothetical protein QOG99_2172 [Frankiales bacterium]|jgi:hypothetical protein|nr:hypothetical protein [Frankiales bacterium]
MNPLGTRARAEELAALLDGAVAGPGTFTASCAGLATRLRALAPALDALAVPRADFRAALRQRLVAVASIQAAAPVPYAEPLARPKTLEAAVSWSQSRKAQRRIGVTAGAMASIVALTGIGVAATRSLPGQPFYGVKRVGEGFQLDLASGDTAKGTKHLEFAATRLREVKALAHHDGSLSLGAPGHPTAAGLAFGGSTDSRIAATLKDFDSETRAGTALLTKVYDKTGKPAPLRIITSFTKEQTSRLSALLPALPAAVVPQAQSSLDLVTKVGSDATDLLAVGTCSGSCYPGNAGPQLPTQPAPAPGATASASQPTDSNGVPDCGCGQPAPSPQPTTAPAPQPTDSSSPGPTASPAPQPTASPSPSPTLLPVPLPSLPVPVPTPPVPLPTLPVSPTLPAVLASALPGLPKS